MKMDKVANSGNDEFYTPEYAVEPILEFIKPHSTIWCLPNRIVFRKIDK